MMPSIITSPLSWDEYNMEFAIVASSRSKDPDTKVGAYICTKDNRPLSMGYNGFPPRMDDFEYRWEKPEKYARVVHAEANAIYNALGSGVSIDGCKIYVTLVPCSGCAKAIISTGIKEVFYLNSRLGDDFDFTKEMMEECGVKLTQINKKGE